VLKALALMAAVLLSACQQGDPRAPFTGSRPPPGLQSRFYAPDGWAWGLVQPGGVPPARYGVSAPSGVPRADILILSSYGEPAEVWFETARALNALGFVVWVLEPVGQGGSGRYSRLRDLGYAESLQPDALAARLMAERVVHRRPLILMASGTSAPAAIQALAAGAPAEGLILTSPRLAGDPAPVLAQARRMQGRSFGWLRADWHGGWSRQGPDDRALGLTHDAARGRVKLAWQAANPELRMGSPSWSWIIAFSDAAKAAQTVEQAVRQPVLVLQPDRGAAANACRGLARCTHQSFAGAGQAMELEADGARGAWLNAITSFMEHTAADYSPAAPGARVQAKG
jgi:lysophospholipase